MQIRVRNGHVEFLRATYNPAIKKSQQKMIKPDDFTDAEREQYDKYKAETDAARIAAGVRQAAENPAWYLSRVTAGFLAGHKPEDEAAFWEQYKALQKAIRKSGLKRPVAAPKTARKTAKKVVKRKVAAAKKQAAAPIATDTPTA